MLVPWGMVIASSMAWPARARPFCSSPADDQQIAGLGLLERQPGALEPGARPVLSFINQYGVVATAQTRIASQSGK